MSMLLQVVESVCIGTPGCRDLEAHMEGYVWLRPSQVLDIPQGNCLRTKATFKTAM